MIAFEQKGKVLFDQVKDLREFADAQFSNFLILQDFFRVNQSNFQDLFPQFLGQVQTIGEFLLSQTPRNELRHAMKAKEELDVALKSHLEELRKHIQKTYASIFDVLEHELGRRGVAQDVIASRQEFVERVGKEENLTELQRLAAKADDFKSEQLEKIVAAVQSQQPTAPVRETKDYRPSRHGGTISNEQDLEKYLQDVRSDMEQLLKDCNIIIIR
jgi:hypothetical protein